MDSSDNLPRKAQICIIGAGLTGLTAAWDLSRRGYDVIVLESTLQTGGMLSGFSMGRDRIEHIYHHLFTSDSHALCLIRQLGLDNSLKWYQVKDALLSDGTCYPFSTPVDLLKLKIIPLTQRIRTGITVLKAARIRDWKPMEKITAAKWLIQNCGEQSYRKLWEPLLKAKFDNDADSVSAVWIWNKFKLRGSSRSSTGKAEKLGYMENSFSGLIDSLANSVMRSSGRILYGYTAMGITPFKNGENVTSYRVSCILEDCSSIDFEADAVIATISCRQFSNLAIGLSLPESYRDKLRQVKYKANICMVLRLKKSLSEYYWTTICDQLPFVVVIEHTNMTGLRDYGGHVVYLSRYLNVTDPEWTKSDGEIYQSFISALSFAYPDFSANDVIDWRLKRSRYAQPVVPKNYDQIRPAMNTPDPGVKLAGMAQIYPEDRGLNYAVRLGREAADAIAGYLDRK